MININISILKLWVQTDCEVRLNLFFIRIQNTISQDKSKG